jgi:hypothetical protein
MDNKKRKTQGKTIKQTVSEIVSQRSYAREMEDKVFADKVKETAQEKTITFENLADYTIK